MDQDFTSQSLVESTEDYLSMDSWEKFWAINGERLIWASWIKKYSDYINPDFLDENKQILMDENNIPKKHSVDHIFNTIEQTKQQQPTENYMRERKFSYDSKVNPYKKRWSNQNSTEKSDKNIEKCNKDDVFIPIGRRRSCSEHDRMLSPRTLAGTDSMTNVTKITLSSYDMSSGHVTSESSPTDDYSVTSSSSDDPSNDQTRIVNVNENVGQPPSEEQDTDEYWQFLWKKHFGEQYALHYANFVANQNQVCYKNIPTVQVVAVPENKVEEKVGDIDGENSEGNSQELPSVIEVQGQVNDMKIEDQSTKIEETMKEKATEVIDFVTEHNKSKGHQITNREIESKTGEIRTAERSTKYKKRNKKLNPNNPSYVGSVGYILQTLLKEEQEKVDTQTEVLETGDAANDKTKQTPQDMADGATNTRNILQSESKSNFSNNSSNEGDNDPPEEKSLKLKRR